MQIKLLVILIVLAVIGGGAYYYTELSLTDEERVVRAMQNTIELDSYTSQFDFGTIALEEDEEVAKISFSAKADVDTVEKAIEGEGAFDIDYQMEGMEMSFSLEGGLLVVDDNLYGKIETIPAPLMVFLPVTEAEMISEITGEWILLQEDLSEETVEDLDEFEMDEETVKKLTKEAEELFVLLWEKEVLLLEDKETDEIDGKKVTKYSVVVDLDNVPEFYEEGVMPFFEFLGEDVLELDEEEMEEMREGLKEAEDYLKDEENIEEIEESLEKLDLYIWTDGNYIHKIRVEMDFKADEDDFDIEDIPEADNISLYFEISYSNFNENFDITAPDDYLLIDDIMQSFEEMMMPSVPTQDFYDEDFDYEDFDIDETDFEMYF